jgi:DNA mismatch repair protein MutS
MDNLINILSELIDDKKNQNKNLTLKYNERDGHHLLITGRRCEILKNKLEKLKEINVGAFKINASDLEFTQMPKINYIKITCNKIKIISNELVLYKIEMAKHTKDAFKKELKNINNIFNSTLNYWAFKIAFIDFINSGAIASIKNHYTKPIIKNCVYSYLKSKEIRHPIVENINTEYEYKPHSISLGKETDQNGILLYGINSSGKSTLMKSIGVNVILAQIGYYTSTKYFEFSPYKALFTRISGNDNIFRGLSSFMVEMIELTSILKRNNQNTLVIGDEICKGTEEKSANIIVAYMLNTLAESNSSFITATHLHKLANLNCVKNLQNVKAKHLKITYDTNNDKLIFDRQLADGQGPSFYGLTVAKYLMKDENFNKVTEEILNDYDGHIIKQAKYNSNNYLIECEICKSKDKLETHHIKFQKDFDNNLIHNEFIHLKKDAEYNLVTLCSNCHDNIDRNKLIIYGWNETSYGKKLNYEIIEEKIKKKNKYKDDFINFIKSLKNETKDPKFARIKIKEKYNIKVSEKSIKSFW